MTVAIDACFNGQSDASILIDNASPALLNVENPMVGMKRGIVLTAGKADQISSWYPEKKHGLFTYFLLKGLRGEADENEDGGITGREMKTYRPVLGAATLQPHPNPEGDGTRRGLGTRSDHGRLRRDRRRMRGNSFDRVGFGLGTAY